ncbi:hypothetical protein RR48_10393 [Papilio machaon]|uniref:PPIase cyclophilin-type domain-containing protein n=1 Tax=Papilio machaon TaxID=76193 RepID=A0A194R4M1_PAPMA|nr:hypothetical protein RR48_10393 [Papilio machaon]
MTLIGAILNKAKSVESVSKKYSSPPPEIDNIPKRKRKKVIDKYKHVKPVVESSPPRYDAQILARNLPKWRRNIRDVMLENTRLVMAIKMTHFNRGRVDNYWTKRLHHTNIYYNNRVNFLKRVQRDNKALYTRLLNAIPRIATTAELERDWQRNRREILYKAVNKFVLFPPVPQETIEDAAFLKPPGVKRQRVYLSVRFRGGAVIGELKVELFDEVCPETCRLFLELLDGDTGYGYIGTCFFR